MLYRRFTLLYNLPFEPSQLAYGKLNSFVYGKERANKIKGRIENILKEAESSSLISDTIKEVQNTILAMVVLLITTTTTAATSIS